MQMSSDSEDVDLPRPLADALRSAYTHPAQVSTRIDHTIVATAHAKFAQRRRLRLVARWGTGVAAALAAVIALAVILRPAPPGKPIAKGDINTDGQVNMVDALVLARHLAANEKSDAAWDVNHDGKIDQADVQALASAAVSLKQTGLAQRLPKLHELGLPNAGLASASGRNRATAQVTQWGQEPFRTSVVLPSGATAPDPFSSLAQTSIPLAKASPTKTPREVPQ